jgi:outer membrane immunogenic protein
MRKTAILAALATIVSGGTSFAADMPTKAPPLAPATVFNWNGFYVGGYAGLTTGRDDWFFPSARTATSPDTSGALAGGQIGYNYQAGNWVVGVEGDGAWTNFDGQSACPNVSANCRAEGNWIASVTGRLGYAWSNVLVYGKGGAAWVNEEYFVRFPATPIFDEHTGSQTQLGWTVGTGLEFAVSQNWVGRVEYDYINLGSSPTYTFTRINTGAVVELLNTKQDFHVFKLGVSYLFGPR